MHPWEATPKCLTSGYVLPLTDGSNAALARVCNPAGNVAAGPFGMITLACAIGAIIILGYSIAVMSYLRRLPDRED